MAKCQTCGSHHLSAHEMCPNVTAHDNRFWKSAEGKRFLHESREMGRKAVAEYFKGK